MLSGNDLKEYLELMGKQGWKILSILSELSPVIEKMDTSPYKEVLEEDVKEHSDLFNKVYASLLKDGKVEPIDVAKLQVLDRRIKKIAKDLASYNVVNNSINKTSSFLKTPEGRVALEKSRDARKKKRGN
jgi:hypothetical protein